MKYTNLYDEIDSSEKDEGMWIIWAAVVAFGVFMANLIVGLII